MRTIVTSIALLAATASAPVAAETLPGRYHVQVTMRVGDAAPVNPNLVAEAGKPATFMIANDRYRIHMTATPGTDGKVALSSEFNAWTPAGLRHFERAAQMEVGGQPVRVAFPSGDPATGATSEVQIEVRVVPATN